MDLPALSKAIVINTETAERIPVMYNPEQYSLDQGNTFAEVGIPGTPAPPLQYVRGRSRTLSMDLFFDTYETAEDVRVHAGRIVALLDQNVLTHAPPVLLFTMGHFAFRCVLVDASQRYTMFLRNGTPVRATLSVKFQEFADVAFEVRQGFFIGAPTIERAVEGRTVAQVSAATLGDAGRWREIADANEIDDPFNLPPGQAVRVPRGGAT